MLNKLKVILVVLLAFLGLYYIGKMGKDNRSPSGSAQNENSMSVNQNQRMSVKPVTEIGAEGRLYLKEAKNVIVA